MSLPAVMELRASTLQPRAKAQAADYYCKSVKSCENWTLKQRGLSQILASRPAFELQAESHQNKKRWLLSCSVTWQRGRVCEM